ncbi:hypothetical protein QRX60_43320 [Amycolatopsis mongoliensis]|uniref:Uncharacterized protein n=1 Tax=Amycolatopsis mongoliensis TaxID=715475 RepID=A0A9Y2JMM1_9PSEU|nr:hypothetical protein [Amycolatopsis sp. 4-36]WIY00818.1 hypothetical protein QRX60_43320 [Amycolatopsis sp. 4-36]
MARLINTLGDRLLGLFLGEVKAGACIPEHGQVCKTLHYDCYGNCK